MIYILSLVIYLCGFFGGYKTCQYFRDIDNKRFKR